jgi:phage tail-like protein
MAPDASTEQLRFRLERCIPTKLKASALNAKDGQLAIEEMQVAYEAMTVLLDGQTVTG